METSADLLSTRRRRRQPKLDSLELRLRGRRALCKRIEDIAPHMLKMVKLRILTNYLPTVKGMEDDDLTRALREHAAKLADRARVLDSTQLRRKCSRPLRDRSGLTVYGSRCRPNRS